MSAATRIKIRVIRRENPASAKRKPISVLFRNPKTKHLTSYITHAFCLALKKVDTKLKNAWAKKRNAHGKDFQKRRNWK